MDERMAELESRIAFQDDAIQSLNDVVVSQQQQIDRLLADLKLLKGQMEAMTPSLMAAEKEETPPPHY